MEATTPPGTPGTLVAPGAATLNLLERQMIVSHELRKPKLKRAGGIWFCDDGSNVIAQGPTPGAAFRAYKQQRVVMNKWAESDPHRVWGAAPQYPRYNSDYQRQPY
jgi:hypothetical protein